MNTTIFTPIIDIEKVENDIEQNIGINVQEIKDEIQQQTGKLRNAKTQKQIIPIEELNAFMQWKILLFLIYCK